MHPSAPLFVGFAYAAVSVLVAQLIAGDDLWMALLVMGCALVAFVVVVIATLGVLILVHRIQYRREAAEHSEAATADAAG